jgi:cell wall assembly regulator SMI1
MSYRGKMIDLSKYERYGKEKEAVELAKMEVELALMDDMKAALKDAKDARLRVNTTVSSVRSAIEGLKNEYKNLRTKALDAGTRIEAYEKAAKDLGLNVPADIKSDKGLMKDFQKLGDTMQGKLTKIEL